ncbi:MAG: SDR family oxidoreductase [Actinomycetota bacterium]
MKPVSALSSDITDSRVIVIGASSGIGHAICSQVAALGASVHMVSRSQARLDEAAADLGGDVRTHAVDALDQLAVENLFAEIGDFDHLAVTAIADETKLFSAVGDLTPELTRRGMEKFWISLYAAQAASRQIRKTGSITLTASTAILNPPRGGRAAVMNSASGATAVLGRSLATELAPVRVNVIAPGVVNSGVWDESQLPELIDFGRELPVRHLGEPNELAAAYIFMMSATYITGVVLPVDGGLSLHG